MLKYDAEHKDLGVDYFDKREPERLRKARRWKSGGLADPRVTARPARILAWLRGRQWRLLAQGVDVAVAVVVV